MVEIENVDDLTLELPNYLADEIAGGRWQDS